MTLPSMNIGGLMSGLDTNGIISSLIDVERIPINQLKSRRSTLTAKDNAWQDISTRFSAIRTSLKAIDTSVERRGFVAAGTSNEAVATASASSTASPGSITFTVDRLATTHRVASTTDFASSSALVGAGDFTITVGGVDHTVTADGSTTLAGLAQQINGLDIGVSASLISIDGSSRRLILTADDSGADAAFTTSSTIASLSTTSVVEPGVDAQLTVGNGPGALTLTRGSNTVTDLLDGVTIDLRAENANAVTISVGTDLDATVSAVEAVMNEIQSGLTRLGTLTAYSADTGKGGVLVGDSTARALQIDLRSTVSGAVQAGATTFNVPASIGISLNRNGTFEIDTAKLRTALEANPDETLDLVGAIADRLDTFLDDVEGSGGRISRARSTWQSQIDLVDERIEQLETRIERREAQLVRQFSGLETAMATLTSQASWLSAQIGSMNGASR